AGFRVVAPDMRGYNLSSCPDGVKAYDTDQLTADIRGLIHERGAQSALLAGHDWGGAVARAPGKADPGGGGRAGHPQRGPSAEALAGTAPPWAAPQILVLLLLRPPRPARNRRARQQLALLPALPARRPPGLHAGGDRTLHRGVVAARRGNRDDQ